MNAQTGTALASSGAPAPLDDDTPIEAMVSTGTAADIVGVDARTIERWVDSEKIRGGRPRDPDTQEPVKGSHRWVDGRDAVRLAIGARRAHLIPTRWRYLVPEQWKDFVPRQSTGS